MPGAFRLVGKEAFDKEIENPSFPGHPTIGIVRMVEENKVVIAEGTVHIARKDGGLLNTVFEMEYAKIKRLTTYQVTLKIAV